MGTLNTLSPLTLFVSLRERVEQHLERGGVAESGQNLHGGGVGQETFAPVHCLSGRKEGRKDRANIRQLPTLDG